MVTEAHNPDAEDVAPATSVQEQKSKVGGWAEVKDVIHDVKMAEKEVNRVHFNYLRIEEHLKTLLNWMVEIWIRRSVSLWALLTRMMIKRKYALRGQMNMEEL